MRSDVAMAKRLFAGSRGFFEAARAIDKIEGADHWPAFLVNLCYAIELSTKAFLAHRGADEKKLRSIGHDLVEGLNDAEALGYRVPDFRIPKLLAMLNPHHKEHRLRYLLGDEAVTTPEPHETLEVVALHIDAIGEQLPISSLV